MKRSTIPLILGLSLLAGCAPVTPASVFLKQVPVNSARTAVVVPSEIRSSLYELAEEITPAYFAASEKKNQIFCPLSLWTALGVLREGAAGETLAELNRLMKLPAGFDSSKVIPDLSRSLNFMTASKLLRDKPDDSKYGIRLTNGIFFDSRYAANIKSQYFETTASVWSAETAQVDFTKEKETKEIIRQWVSDKTDRFMEDYEATFETDGSAILNIYNVLYLTDLWLVPFQKLQNQTFHAPSGDVQVPFVGRLADGTDYVDHAKAQAVAFPGEQGIRVWFLLPRGEAEPLDLIPELASILSEGSPALVDFKAPALDINGENLSLKKLLIDKGYTNMFLSADLSNMLSGVTASVTEIKQKTKLQLDEKGFKAAAVTEIGVGKTSLPGDNKIEFTLDRPYLLVIEYQGLPLFISRIQDPSEK